jgi:hypothetical protein
MVKIEIIVEYNGAEVLAAPICLPRGDVYSFYASFLIYKWVYSEWIEQ